MHSQCEGKKASLVDFKNVILFQGTVSSAIMQVLLTQTGCNVTAE